MPSHSPVPSQQRLRSNWLRPSIPPTAHTTASAAAYAVHAGSPPKPCRARSLRCQLLSQVACGECHSVALTCDGRVWTWGGAGFGQLGRGKVAKGLLAAVELDAVEDVCVRIAAGAHHTVAVTQGGSAFAWGKGDEGQLGDGRGCSSNLPVRVLMSAEEDGEASDSEGDGQGWEDAADTASSEQECDKVTSCFASGNMTILATRAGACFTFGDGCSGQQAMPLDRCGRRFVLRPRLVGGLPRCAEDGSARCIVACGGAHVVVAVQTAAEARVKPAAASFFGAQRSDDILKDASGSCTSDASAACTRGSVEVWGWGCNARGQLGPLAPSGSVVLQPQRLHVLSAGARLDSIVAGMHHTAIFTREVKAGAGGSPASQKGVDVVRQNGGWVKIYRSRAAAEQFQVTWFGMGESAAPSMADAHASVAKPIERVRFMWGRGQVALAGVTAAVLAAAAGGTKTLRPAMQLAHMPIVMTTTTRFERVLTTRPSERMEPLQGHVEAGLLTAKSAVNQAETD